MTTAKAWRDDALTSADQDELGTAHVARSTAQLIADTHSFDSSTVVGLVGPWGSGKSSIAAMACEALVADETAEWSVGRFTPWATAYSESMMADFYATLSALLPKDKGAEVRKGLTRMARLGTSALKFIPVAGDVASELAKGVVDQLLQDPSWDEAFSEVAGRLATLKLRVLIVVDDVDRLQQSELTTLLKVIRLVGRFPGVSYLLAYDEQTLFATLRESALAAHTDQTARLFMEKVVQYPVTVPPLLHDQILVWLDQGLDAALDDLGRPVDDADSRLSSLTDVYVSQLRTPRALNRFLAQVRLTLSMHDVGEVDEVDIVLVTLLRVQFPDVYAQLPRWKAELTGGMSTRRMMADENFLRGRDTNVDFTELFASVADEQDRQDVQDIVARLFPATSKYSMYPARPQSMRNIDYFDRYLVHQVPAGDVPDAQVRAALRQASEGTAADLMVELLTEGSASRIELAVRHLWSASVMFLDELDLLNLLGAVMQLWSSVPQEHRLIIDSRQRMTSWAADLIGRLPESTTAQALVDALSRCPDKEGPLHVMWQAREHNDAVRQGAPGSNHRGASQSVAEAGSRLADQMLEELLEHLHDGDDADPTFSALFRMYFIEVYGNFDDMVTRVRGALTDGVSLETLASRCVTIAWSTGVAKPSGRLQDFERKTFAAFPDGPDDFFNRPREEGLDLSDLSWANRRLFARGQADAPPQPAEVTEKQAAGEDDAG